MPNSDRIDFKKIALLRANGLGDLIFALPAIKALKTTFPNATLVYLGKFWHKEFLKYHPEIIDKVIVIPPIKGVGENFTDTKALPDFFEKVRKEDFDLAVQIHGGGHNSNPFVKKLGAKLSIGLMTPDASELDLNLPYIYYQNEVFRCLEVVSLVAAESQSIEPTIRVAPEELKEAEPFLPNRQFAVLVTGATDSRRRWPIENFAKVADALDSQGLDVIITGSSEETDLAKQLLRLTKTSVKNLIGKLSLSALTGLLFQAKIVVGNDTGPLHLARSLGTKTVGIFWCGNLINAGPATRAKNYPAVSWQIYCSMCRTNMATNGIPFSPQNSCDHNESFVRSVPTREVIEHSLRLIDKKYQFKKEVSYA